MAFVKSLFTFLLIALGAYAALVAILYVSQRAILYPGADAGAPIGERWGEAVAIGTPDGETLFGLHSAALTGRPSVLSFLGNADRVGNYGFLARALSARGIGLLAISYRGYPGSTGTPSEQGLLVDGLAAFDWLTALGDGPVVLLGQSLGSGVAVNTAVERPAAAVVLVSPYLSVQSLAQAHYPFLPVSLLISDPFRSDLRIGSVRQPKLFVHGRLDRVIPLSSGEALYAIAPDPKSFLIYDDAGHNDVWNKDLTDEIVRFIESSGP
ncbi:alpha/beta hydrolase [Mesorhizobium sp. KR9-304]|uniref:alpha/beta hydrolase n=1 Tax=Mesorhizobium sp. KR9-304 TaxID=3156614 RepID=UPI0032B3B15E